MTRSQQRALVQWSVIIAGALLIAYFGVTWVMKVVSEPPPTPKKTVQNVQLVRPPPPPPPKEIEKPPEPEIEEEVDIPEPEAMPEEAPSDQPPPGDLGLDAEGVAGGDAFGLLARRGGRDLLASGSGDRFKWYAGVLQQEILDLLADDPDIRRRRYTVEVRLWLSPDGRVRDVRLAGSTGSAELDQLLETKLAAIDRIAEAPPGDLPQPVQLRIVSRL